jgi:hypothetical protein
MKSYHVRIHIFFAVIMYEFIYILQKLRARATRGRAPRARSASREGEARAPDQAAPDLCRSDPIHTIESR